MITRISQSFIKDYRDYVAGNECGNIIIEKYIEGRLIEDDEPGAKDLGAYFEYIATGALPKSGKIPEPQYMQAPLKKKKAEDLLPEDMLSPYRKAYKSGMQFKQFIADIGLKIIEVGRKKTKGRFDGVIDLKCEVIEVKPGYTWKVGDKIVIDLKYSGLVGDTVPARNKHGWNWSPAQKEYHGTQAKHYHMITNLPFYFLIFQSNQKEEDDPIIKFFYVPVDEHMIERHVIEANELYDKFVFESTIGFVPRPSYNKCIDCPLRDNCKDKHDVPVPVEVDLNQ